MARRKTERDELIAAVKSTIERRGGVYDASIQRIVNKMADLQLKAFALKMGALQSEKQPRKELTVEEKLRGAKTAASLYSFGRVYSKQIHGDPKLLALYELRKQQFRERQDPGYVARVQWAEAMRERRKRPTQPMLPLTAAIEKAQAKRNVVEAEVIEEPTQQLAKVLPFPNVDPLVAIDARLARLDHMMTRLCEELGLGVA